MPTYLVIISRWVRHETAVEIEARTKEAALGRARDQKFLEDIQVDGNWEVIEGKGASVSRAYRLRPGGDIRRGR